MVRQKKILNLIIICMFSVSANAGFFTSVAGGVAANAVSGSNGARSDSSINSFFIILNKKINLLDMQIKILIGANIFLLILLIWIMRRQNKHLQTLDSIRNINNKELKND